MHKIETINNEMDWHKGRAKGIGGSDVASLLGVNPYKSNLELWQEKTGRKKPKDISVIPCVIYGKKAEEYLRELFKLDYPQYEVNHRVYDLHIHNDFDFIRASLDGELLDVKTSEKGFLECKTAEIRRSSDWAKWDKKIPMNYFCQILHYFAIDPDFKFCVLKAQLKHKVGDEVQLTTKHYHILRENYLDDIDYLINKECEFWLYVKTDKEPPLILPEI